MFHLKNADTYLIHYFYIVYFKMRKTTLFLCTLATCLTLSLGCKKGKLNFNHVQQIETGTDGRINDIFFIDNQVGFAVGGKRFSEALIFKTTDGGDNWIKVSYPEAGKGLYGINQSSSGKIQAIGFDGKMLHTTDTGNNWQFKQLSPWYSYKDVYLKSDNSGIVIGGNSFNSGYIVHIDANGQNQSSDSFAIELNDIKMLDDQTGFITGYGVVLKTTNSWQTWNFLDIKNDNFTAIYALNNSDMWVCGKGGSIYRTTNGGSSWERQRNGNAITRAKYMLNDILFIDHQTGWAVGEDGVVLKTTDGGNKWEKYKDFTGSALFCIKRAPDGNLIVGGENGSLYKLHIN